MKPSTVFAIVVGALMGVGGLAVGIWLLVDRSMQAVRRSRGEPTALHGFIEQHGARAHDSVEDALAHGGLFAAAVLAVPDGRDGDMDAREAIQLIVQGVSLGQALGREP